MPTYAEVMARSLAERGVEYVFGLPGGEILAFVDACRRAGLRFVLTGHEASAAWIAQVLGQITGVPGVCATTLGPGATNLATGVANALVDRAPLVAVTAQIPKQAIATMTHQRLDLHALFSPITKGSFAIGEGDTAELIQRGLDLALAPRSGPVHVSLASDLAARECAAGTSMRTRPVEPSNADIRAIAARLQSAARPLVLIGLGAQPSAAPAIRALVDRLQAPFMVTPKVKGIVPEDHPLFAGVASGMAIDKDIVETIRAADLVLAIGFDPVECDKTWFASVEIISIDDVSMKEGEYRPLEAIGNIAALVAQVPAETKPWPPDILEARRAAIRRASREPAAGRVSPLRLIEALRAAFPRNGIAACDVGSHKLAMGQFWRSYEPGTFFMSNGLSGMGFGIPAAIAAQLAHPDKPVMAVVGDGGMLMMLHDLALIRELSLPIIVVVLSDRSLSLIRVSAERRGLPPYGVDFSPPDFAALAKGFGISSASVSTVQEASNCVQAALEQRIPFLIEVPIDHREYYELV
jgi:acetolactate synthase-1/2/3 large subunit